MGPSTEILYPLSLFLIRLQNPGHLLGKMFLDDSGIGWEPRKIRDLINQKGRGNKRPKENKKQIYSDNPWVRQICDSILQLCLYFTIVKKEN
jgi:hypothetical protein